MKGSSLKGKTPHCHVVLHLFCGMLKREKKSHFVIYREKYPQLPPQIR